MTVVRIKGIKQFRDRHGKWRRYHRKTGLPIKAEFGSGEFFEELARLDGIAKQTVKPKSGTLGMLVTEYRASSDFSSLAPRTRADYQRVLDYLKPIADTPLIRFERGLVVRIRDKASERGRRFANYVKAVLSILFSWGVERGYLHTNPAERVKNIRRPKGAPEANRPWTDAERHAVLDAAPPQMRPALSLMMSPVLDRRTRYRCHAASTRAAKSLRAGPRLENQSSGLPLPRFAKLWPLPLSTMRLRCAQTPTDDRGPKMASARLGVRSACVWKGQDKPDLA
jgi:hypothetical protein